MVGGYASVRRAAWLPSHPDDAEGHCGVDEDPAASAMPAERSRARTSLRSRAGWPRSGLSVRSLVRPRRPATKSISRASPGSPGSGSMATLPTAVSITSSGSCPRRELSVVTIHRVPEFFDNRNLAPGRDACRTTILRTTRSLSRGCPTFAGKVNSRAPSSSRTNLGRRSTCLVSPNRLPRQTGRRGAKQGGGSSATP